MPCLNGEKLRVTLFGASHAPCVGAVIEGLPAGEAVDMEEVRAFLRRRAPGRAEYATARREADEPELLSGLQDGKTCGAPLCAVIRNTDAHPADYAQLADLPRPGHADYPAYVKYGGQADMRGGGVFSGRMTAPLCFAGAVCLQLLARRGVFVGAHILSIADVMDRPFAETAVSREILAEPGRKAFPVLNDAAGARMREAIADAHAAADSLGGVVECAALGLPVGLGGPLFDGLESRLGAAFFGIPAVKGVAFGDGFAAAGLRGSEHNDAYYWDSGAVRTRTNHCGGILGGMSDGMPLLCTIAFKPTPSIGREQQTVSLASGENAPLKIAGRHDPCVVPRAVPCVEAAAAAVLLDMLLQGV